MSTRRRVALAALAGSSLAAGAWLGFGGLDSSKSNAADANNAKQNSDANAQSPEKALFQLSFDQPSGGSLDLKNFQGKPILLNFWATWCPPCVAELPLIERFYVENRSKNWQVIGLAVDQLAAAQQFLKKMPLSFPIGMAGLAGIELSRSLGNLAGGLPYTVVLAADGSVSKRHIGALTPEHLASFAAMKF
jgi:thiol-disulfide isomerase/thioredoxin